MTMIGKILGGIGFFVILISFGVDTAPEGTHNIGLLQQQMMYFAFGAALSLAGVIMGTLGHALNRMEEAGILPPTGYKPDSVKAAAERQL